MDKKTYFAHRKFHQESPIHNDLKRFMFLVKLIPIIFFGTLALISYLLYSLFRLNFPVMILMFFLAIILIREVGTLFYMNRLRSRIIEPIEDLKMGVNEIAKGNYGYKIDCCFPPNEIGELFHSFNQMSEELKEAHEAKQVYEQNRRELIAGISHDLKTPITSIMGYIDGIHEGVANTPEKLKHYTDIIYYNAHYTNQLIDDLFLFSKLDIHQVEFDMKPVDLNQYFKDVFQEKQIELEEKGITLNVVNLLQIDTTLNIDGKMIHRVITNILSNAVKYKREAVPVIQVTLGTLPQGVQISIKDNGPGIDAEKIPFIFDRFYRIDPSRNKDIGGTGLGLAIAKELVRAHGGDIWAESHLGEGTTVHFTLTNQERKEPL